MAGTRRAAGRCAERCFSASEQSTTEHVVRARELMRQEQSLRKRREDRLRTAFMERGAAHEWAALTDEAWTRARRSATCACPKISGHLQQNLAKCGSDLRGRASQRRHRCWTANQAETTVSKQLSMPVQVAVV